MSSFIEGIDVSSNQGAIDSTSVVQGSISFCFARAALGARSVDSRFTANWRGVSNAGLIRDAYHVFWPSADSSQQADHFVSVVGALGPSDLARALDLEEVYPRGDRQHDIWTFIPAAQRLPMVRDWRNRVEQALGMRPLIYTRQNFNQTLLGEGIQALAGYPLWVSHYTDAPQPHYPATWKSWTFWQYSDHGQADGLTGGVDLDRFNGTVAELQVLTKTSS